MANDESRERVNIASLRDALNKILDNVESSGVKAVNIKDDDNLFWEFDIHEMFNVRGAAPTPGIGSIQDSAEFLAIMTKHAKNPTDAPPLMLMHVAPLLLYIAHRLR
jgi:hypothetical protein